ncbi:hypothetical protein LJC07_06865 [Christensenellaceae bacterium OttesenSCG-928-L17]|nr:hypothetical protein [Christensenellaceae bacterium OttesenSCG-928-L17]
MNTWSFLIALLGAFVSSATFFAGRRSASKQEGKETGTMLTEIGYIKSGIDDIKRKQSQQDEKHVEIISRLTALESATEQAHQRLNRLEANTKK